jgi:hypothetical protein
VNDVEAEVLPSDPVSEPLLDEKEALRQSIERSEAELREAVGELTAVVKSEVSLGSQIMANPTVWLVGGFAVGVLLAVRR